MLVGEWNGKRRGRLCESLLLSGGGGGGRPGAGPTVCLHSPTAGRPGGRDGPQSSSQDGMDPSPPHTYPNTRSLHHASRDTSHSVDTPSRACTLCFLASFSLFEKHITLF